MNPHIRYLSLSTVAQKLIMQKVLLVLGGILTVFFTFGVVGGILDYSEGLRKGIPVYAVFLIPSVLVFLMGLNIGRQIGAARRYETIFSADRDGVVALGELVGQMGKSEMKIFMELEKLFRAGYFVNCTLQRGGAPCVLIVDAMVGETGVGFVTVACINCGGQSRIRAGSRGACQYCGAPIAAPNDTVQEKIKGYRAK